MKPIVHHLNADHLLQAQMQTPGFHLGVIVTETKHATVISDRQVETDDGKRLYITVAGTQVGDRVVLTHKEGPSVAWWEGEKA